MKILFLRTASIRTGMVIELLNKKIMTNQKQFGIWLDTRQAVIIGKENLEDEQFTVLATVASDDIPGNTSEKNHNHHEKTVQLKYFKSIAIHLHNATNIHITGTGQVQEQFIHWNCLTGRAIIFHITVYCSMFTVQPLDMSAAWPREKPA